MKIKVKKCLVCGEKYVGTRHCPICGSKLYVEVIV